MKRNAGRVPPETVIWDEDGNVAGYRQVRVTLFNGLVCGPWPSAGGRPHPTNWKISRPPHPFEIESYEVI